MPAVPDNHLAAAPGSERICSLQRFPSKGFWNKYWSGIQLPRIAQRKPHDTAPSPILDAFDRFLPTTPGAKVLEVGGAPGQFLAYGASKHGWQAHALDYSDVGCQMTIENFRLLGVPIVIHEQDLFDTESSMPAFDAVYSLGVIEHFQDTRAVVERHWDMVRPGGILLLGVPHFVHVFWPILTLLAPRTTQGHNRQALNHDSWLHWEQDLGMTAVYKGYVGGFDPSLIPSVIDEELAFQPSGPTTMQRSARLLLRCFIALWRRAYRVFPTLRRLQSINGPSISAYAIAVYQKPGVPLAKPPD